MPRLSTLQNIGRSVRNLVTREPVELEPAAAYELWAPTYDDIAENALLHTETSAVEPLLRQIELKGKSVLDAGCGTGRYLSLLNQFHPRLLAGVDLSPGMLQRARGKAISEIALLGAASLENLPFRDGEFDFVLSTLALGHIADLGGAVAELSRVMHRTGTILISCFHPFGKLLSWKRSFRSESPSEGTAWFSAKYHLHLYADYFKALHSAGIQVLNVLEPVIDESIRPFYERARRLDIYERFHGYPLLLILLARKQ